LTKRQAAVDLLLTVLLVIGSSLAAAVLLALVFSGPPDLPTAIGVQAVFALLGTRILLARREQSWRSIGLEQPRWLDVPRALLVLASGFAANLAIGLAVTAIAPETFERHLAGLEDIAGDLTLDLPLPATAALLFLVGFYEEIVARGLLLQRARLLVGARAAVVVSAALFALGHFYQGPFGVVQTALLGAILALYTLRWGTLWPAIFAHTAFNLLSVLELDALLLSS
jgi:membrane protease YdiL (CAAX protease family)